MSARHTR